MPLLAISVSFDPDGGRCLGIAVRFPRLSGQVIELFSEHL
jgi:hypothetical protein